VTPAERLVALSRLALTMSEDTAAIEEAARVIVASIIAGGTVYVCGNGGSHAQARHFAEELTGRYKRERRPLAAVALGCNSTGIANDYGYRHALAREFRALHRGPADALLWLTTSGESGNVNEARKVALEQGTYTVGILGANPDAFVSRYECVVRVPTEDVSLTQEMTLHVLHGICAAIDEGVCD